jgi:putative serine/threonine protein kinase
VKVLCYPSGSLSEAMKRIESLKELGVEALIFSGKVEVAGLKVLGKGHAGVVVKSLWNGKETALKIRRIDSDRQGFEREAEILAEANRMSLGPSLYRSSRDFIVMEELEGETLEDWLKGSGAMPDDEFREALLNVCEQARLLDVAGIDHKELSDARRHVIIQADRRARLLDFETASMGGRMRNVNSLLHFLALSGRYGSSVLSRLGASRDEVLAALRAYRLKPGIEPYERIMKAMKLR